MRSIVFLVVAFFVTPFASAQNCPPGTLCPTPLIFQEVPCPPPIVFVDEQQSRGPSDASAVRVLNGGSCGSGSVCGLYQSGCLVLTNAHVAGTRIGREVKIDFQTGESLPGRVIVAAYSDQYLTDWAIIYVEDFTNVHATKLTTKKPLKTTGHYTRGAPRCVWPLVSTSVTTADISDNSPLWRWRPNSIGGQSGSAVWSVDSNLQVGLLTWSWGGLGAGQQTASIYQQAKERSNIGAPRIPGLLLPQAYEEPVELKDGFFLDTAFFKEDQAVELEVGFFAQAGIVDLPIWADEDPGPGPGPGPDPTAKERELLALLRLKATASGVDYDALIVSIFELLRAR